MKPASDLISAWCNYLRSAAEVRIARSKAKGMFGHANEDNGFFLRADALEKHATRTEIHARVQFCKALKQRYAGRFRTEWVDSRTCTVWVREPYQQEENAMCFTKITRCPR